jgi:hypothetical protein
MKSKDQTLLEQAYHQVMETITTETEENKSMIKSDAEDIDLTPEQLVTLLTNVYGLSDKYGTLFRTPKDSFQEAKGVVRMSSNVGSLDVSMEGAFVDGSSLSLVRWDGELQRFTLLGAVNGKDLLN